MMRRAPSLYDLKFFYRRTFRRLPFADKIGRALYHAYLRARVTKYRDGFFEDVYGLLYNFDPNSLLERQMAAAGYWEEDTRAIIDSEISPGDIVIEVGSNFGAHTLPISLKIGPQGRVYGIEPSDYGFDRLKRNIALNPCASNITLLKRYISSAKSESTEVELTSYWTPSGVGNDTAVRVVRNARLDDLLEGLSQLHLIKIDVDGADHDALSSGEELVGRFHPKIYIEVSSCLAKFGSTPRRLCTYMLDLGYSLYVWSPSRRAFESSTVEEVEALLKHQPVVNILAR